MQITYLAPAEKGPLGEKVRLLVSRSCCCGIICRDGQNQVVFHRQAEAQQQKVGGRFQAGHLKRCIREIGERCSERRLITVEAVLPAQLTTWQKPPVALLEDCGCTETEERGKCVGTENTCNAENTVEYGCLSARKTP